MVLPDIAPLANQLAPMLLPYLPALLQGAKLAGDAVTAAGRKLGEVDWDTALKIWDKFKPQVKEQPDLNKRFTEVAVNSADPDAETLLSWELKKLLTALQPEELTEIKNILVKSKTETRTVTASGERSVAIGGDAAGTITTGDQTNKD